MLISQNLFVLLFLQMQGEAAKRVIKASSCKQEVNSYEQAFDGRERQVTEAGVSSGV